MTTLSRIFASEIMKKILNYMDTNLGAELPKLLAGKGFDHFSTFVRESSVLTDPQQIVAENQVFVAQSKRGNGLLRIVFVNIGKTKRILTLYWTNQVNRYWQEDNHES
jgi:hypothetical protein